MIAKDASTPNAGPIFDRRFARHLWRLIRIYWGSPDARWGSVLLAIAVALEIGTVAGTFLVANAERRIIDGLEQRDATAFAGAIGVFFVATLGFVFASAYRIYTRQAVEIRWRRGLTVHYVERWITAGCHLIDVLPGVSVDNPQQRIQEDVRDFVASALGLSLSLLAAVATLVSFGRLLYTLSEAWPIPIGGTPVVPGLMLWVAIAYALLSMWITHRVGRRLVPINFDRLRLEADFRYGLVHFRDNATAVALSRGEREEQREAMARFRHVIANWWQLVRAQLHLGLLTGGIGQANALVPILIAAPAYFAHLLTLGAIVQVRIAYGQISGALTWFVFAYGEIARWRANVERLSTLDESLDATERAFHADGIRVVPTAGRSLRLDGVGIAAPDGRVLLHGATATVAAGDRVAVVGPSGTGKTLLLRAIAGIWPFGTGRIETPANARMLFVPQWPYLPIGTLRAAVSYPDPEGTFPDLEIAEAMALVGLTRLNDQLDDAEPWEQLLSPHQQQQLAIARVLLQKPDWIFLDKATSALDEETEGAIYGLLNDRLPGATIVTIAHRASVAEYHSRRWTITAAEGGTELIAA
jgi:vitamin B12/bleomycin/antimicrobial peptide transport system ATP-binding/permease protein